MTPTVFYENSYRRNEWDFFSQILHTNVLNKHTRVHHFWCFISKYTEYDKIFINWSIQFPMKIFNVIHIKWSLLRCRIVFEATLTESVTLNVQSVRQPWTQMLVDSMSIAYHRRAWSRSGTLVYTKFRSPALSKASMHSTPPDFL